METAKELANRFREVFLNGKRVAFINYNSVLADVTFQEATTKIGTLNTIAALTFHVNYYVAGVLQVLEGGTLDIRDKYSYNMPVISEKSQWENMRDTLISNCDKFASQIDMLSNELLAKPFVKEEYGDYQLNMNMMIEHGYYHLGQIALLKKMVREGLMESS